MSEVTLHGWSAAAVAEGATESFTTPEEYLKLSARIGSLIAGYYHDGAALMVGMGTNDEAKAEVVATYPLYGLFHNTSIGQSTAADTTAPRSTDTTTQPLVVPIDGTTLLEVQRAARQAGSTVPRTIGVGVVLNDRMHVAAVADWRLEVTQPGENGGGVPVRDISDEVRSIFGVMVGRAGDH